LIANHGDEESVKSSIEHIKKDKIIPSYVDLRVAKV
jgi:hypothetical protein